MKPNHNQFSLTRRAAKTPISQLAVGVTAWLMATAMHGKEAGEAATQRPAACKTNSLGMVFVPVPGITTLFSIYETRKADFAAFVKDTGFQTGKSILVLVDGSMGFREDFNWQKLGFEQGPTHPVVGISWNEARAFCQWLTEKERKENRLGADEIYRLPTDPEWSSAAGLENETGDTPMQRSRNKKVGQFYWGEQWPPPPGTGNFGGEEVRTTGWPAKMEVISGYNDGYPRTAPVGSFKPNRNGLYDLEGNAMEWCEDAFNKRAATRVHRGGVWFYEPCP